MAPVTLTTRLLQSVPPWLTREVGGALIRQFGGLLDAIAVRGADGVKLRFPTLLLDTTALALIGQERRIRRGPGEAASTYASRLPRWWDDHRGRGGPYALLRQLYAYFAATLRRPIDLVYQSGTRYRMDVAGEITRDAISWEGDAGGWAQTIWLIWDIGDTYPVPLVDENGNQLVDEEGNVLVAEDDSGVLTLFTEEDLEVFKAVPREWLAGHIPYATIVLLYGAGWLVGYPPWELGASSGRVLGEDVPLVFTTEIA